MLINVLLVLLVNLVIATCTSLSGHCAIYGTCGKKSMFGASLPCPGLVKASAPSEESARTLRSICGADFPVDKVCCSPDQIAALQSNLKKVDPLISSCPACKRNFYDFFCQFSCSSDQATFVNVTKVALASDTKQEVVTELSQYVNATYAEEFFNSCKNLKFSATNGFAMDLIGGGATNYQQFLKFLGDEKPLLGGSPFQINFEYNGGDKAGPFKLRTGEMKRCDDEEYKCACSDCLESCPNLPEFKDFNATCKIGPLPCFSFAVVSIGLTLIVVGILFHLKKWKGHQKGNQTPGGIISEQHSSPILEEVTPDDEETDTIVPIHPSPFDSFFAYTSFQFASNPWKTIISSLVITLLLSSGLGTLKLETDPVNLWVSPNEPAFLEKQYFEEKFGEFYRIEQLIISSNDSSPVLSWDTIQWWFAKEQELTTLNNSLLSSICFKPLGETCAIESFTQYFQGDINYLTPSNWKQQISGCTSSPVNCLPSFQQPLKSNLLFDNENILEAQAFVVTLLINNNSTDVLSTKLATDFESSLIDWIENSLKKEAAKLGLHVSYSTESSLTTELNQSTNTDIKIVIISYLTMFLYASLALGGRIPQFGKGLKSLVTTRFQLGLGGIAIILLSVSSSAGAFAFIGLKSTLIIAEVIPFLVLAVGIDNIFLIVHELQLVSTLTPNDSVEMRISTALRNIGPSCLISALLQLSMFLIATWVEMPAVKNFAYYSAGAILCNFLLQMSAFIGLLALDQKRMEEGRLDLFPWVSVSVELEDQEEQQEVQPAFIRKLSSMVSNYPTTILTPKIKRKLISLFVVWFAVSLSLLPKIEYGLDQRIALPADSYLVDYFNSVYKYLNVGPPIFFVTKDLDVTERSGQHKLCGKFSTCNEFSVANILEQEFKRGNKSTIADPTSSWLDDFLTWLNPDLDQCCRLKKSTLDKKSPEFCGAYTPERQCQSCFADHSPPYDISMDGFPEGKDFMFYFDQWIEEPSDPCPLGGKAPYSNSISTHANGSIEASYFRTSHVPLRSQNDFIVAYKNSRRIIDEIKQYEPDLDIFSYSPFYVFFVQYQTILTQTLGLLTAAGTIILVVSTILLGTWKVATAVTATVAMIVVNICGVMSIWSISLNAVSLVNLVICVGLAVEFTIHIARAFTRAEGKTSSDRALVALQTAGGSVFGGITITKLIGVSVLAFTRSKIFEVYYFRMWISLVFIAGVHGLCFLPILLSYL
ncbi:NPC intracellular sterol transporter 1-related protein 1 [[Candida] anglica]|uniref:NPC intracellular sterol transporter 1-related protein 1 n=1 Tax=[Candida] anglica TaxID=148631 RepID=A0ABP0E9L5_9ASCO